MTIGQVFNDFYSGFGIGAYPKTAVPDDVKLPYITYDVIESNWDSTPISQTVQIWYRTASEAIPSAKAKEIKNMIGEGGILLRCEDGYIWLKKGTPWCINSNSNDDNMLKLRQLNVTVEFLMI